MNRIKMVALASIFAALTLALSPLWIPWGPSKAFPGQHLVNVLSGIILGPLGATVVSLISGTLRIMLGTGTIFAYPGGIPGGIIVGIAYKILKRIVTKRKALIIASLSEPIGTVLIGGTLAYYLIDPFFGSIMHAQFATVLLLYYGWAISSIIGSVLGMITILALERTKVIELILCEGV
jgi:energy coupling factor transporter S component ThiW